MKYKQFSDKEQAIFWWSTRNFLMKYKQFSGEV